MNHPEEKPKLEGNINTKKRDCESVNGNCNSVNGRRGFYV